MLGQNSPDSGPTDFETQFAQLPFQFVVSQTGIVLCDAENPLLQFASMGDVLCRFC